MEGLVSTAFNQGLDVPPLSLGVSMTILTPIFSLNLGIHRITPSTINFLKSTPAVEEFSKTKDVPISVR